MFEMEYETEEGTLRRENLQIQGPRRFWCKSITNQSEYLKELNMKKLQYQKIIQSNWRPTNFSNKAIASKNLNENMVQALQVLIHELENAQVVLSFMFWVSWFG